MGSDTKKHERARSEHADILELSAKNGAKQLFGEQSILRSASRPDVMELKHMSFVDPPWHHASHSALL